ncbi:MAG: hypothetical protein ACRDNK_08470, partial [Solirubrobacteraceae bacterium]
LVGAYAVMLTVIYLLTRNVFAVDFEWGRLARLVVVMGGLTAAGDLVLPTHGALGLLTRLAVFAAIPFVLLATGFAHWAELRQARALVTRLRAGRSAAPAGSEP